METIKSCVKIEAWETASELTKLVYALSNEEAFSRDLDLCEQMRRAVVSIMSDIAYSAALVSLQASGFKSQSQVVFIDFLGQAKDSVGKLRSQACIALDACCINQSQFTQLFNLIEKCNRQITAFTAYLIAYFNTIKLREGDREYCVDTVER